MKFYITLSRKTLSLIFAVVIMSAIILGQFFSAHSTQIDGSTNEIRVMYIKSLGLEVDDADVTSKEIIIPKDFDDVYKEYNLIQKKSGFNLYDYKGEKATVYTYKLDSPKDYEAHLIVCGENIIGGDIASLKLDGEMLPLNYMK